MCKTKTKIITGLLIMAFTIMSIANPVFAISGDGNVNHERIFGNDRYDTAVRVSQSGWNTSEYAVLAAGMDKNLVDALAAAPLAKSKDAPILFSAQKGLTNGTISEIRRLGVKTVYLVTGKETFDQALFDQLDSLGIKVSQLGGKDRFQTSVNIAKELNDPSKIVLTTAWSNADALSIASIAAAKGYPILLSDAQKVPDVVLDYINNQVKSEVEESYLIGGEKVLSNNLQYLLKNPKRLGGSDRFETNLAIIQNLMSEVDLNKSFTVNGTDKHLVDALAISPLAAKTNSAVILVGSGVKTSTLDGFSQLLTDTDNLVTVGSERLVPDSTLSKLKGEAESTEKRPPVNVTLPAKLTTPDFIADSFSLRFEGNSLIANFSPTKEYAYVWLKAFDRKGTQISSEEFPADSTSKVFQLGFPDGNGKISLGFGENEYGIYMVYYSNIKVLTTEGETGFKFSEVYAHNKNIINNRTVPSKSSLSLSGFNRDDLVKLEGIVAEATAGVNDDYGKARAIANWVSENIYYDYDAYNTGRCGATDAMGTLNAKKSVCQGYAELTRALLRTAGIPTELVSGHALGISAGGKDWSGVNHNRSNHAWNEAYIGGRWIIIDTTWDSGNKYENGEFKRNNRISRYFDPTLEAFSNTHKIIIR